jgi:hypothetical protein
MWHFTEYESICPPSYSASRALDRCGAYLLKLYSWIVDTQSFDFEPGTWTDMSISTGFLFSKSIVGVYIGFGGIAAAAASEYEGFIYGVSRAQIEALQREDVKFVLISKLLELNAEFQMEPVPKWSIPECCVC